VVSQSKTEVQCIGKDRPQLKIFLGDEELKQVNDFVYLGETVSSDQSYDTLVQAVVLYNAETWTMKEEHKRKLRVFEM